MCSDLDAGVRAGGSEIDLTPTHERIAKTGKAIFQQSDVSSEEDVKTLVDSAVREYGRLDMCAPLLILYFHHAD